MPWCTTVMPAAAAGAQDGHRGLARRRSAPRPPGSAAVAAGSVAPWPTVRRPATYRRPEPTLLSRCNSDIESRGDVQFDEPTGDHVVHQHRQPGDVIRRHKPTASCSVRAGRGRWSSAAAVNMAPFGRSRGSWTSLPGRRRRQSARPFAKRPRLMLGGHRDWVPPPSTRWQAAKRGSRTVQRTQDGVPPRSRTSSSGHPGRPTAPGRAQHPPVTAARLRNGYHHADVDLAEVTESHCLQPPP